LSFNGDNIRISFANPKTKANQELAASKPKNDGRKLAEQKEEKLEEKRCQNLKINTKVARPDGERQSK
jgi:hypothetical protein